MTEKLSSILVSFEAVPFAKVGGLADVAGALPDALAEVDVDCTLIMPRFGQIDVEALGLEALNIPDDWYVGIDYQHHPFRVWQGRLPGGARVLFLGDDRFFGRRGIYNDENGAAFADELERSIFFSKGVVELIKCLGLKPDVIHLNDFQTALVAPYLRQLYAQEACFADTGLVYSIHNMAYQGVYGADRLGTMGFDPRLCRPPEPFEFHGAVNLMKLGILFSDGVNTVSPTYAREIMTEAGGCGLDGLLRAYAGKLRGILNGIDTDVWNPERDPRIPYHYRPSRMSGKKGCKGALLEKAGLSLDRLDKPLVGMVGRLVSQKGLDLVAEAFEEMLQSEASFVVLGSGEKRFEDLFRDMATRYPDRVGARIGFDEDLAHLITAGADLFLMPSHYEPCGLNQMYSLRYGTLPIVRRTGGLADTVFEWNPGTGEGNGFLFERASAANLLAAFRRALAAYDDKKARKRLIANAMAEDHSWRSSAGEYRELYTFAQENWRRWRRGSRAR